MRWFNLSGVLLLAFLVRLLGVTARPLWYDEAFTVLFSEKGYTAMRYGTLASSGGAAADVHPLAYYSLLWGWMRLFGQSPVAVRSLSILFGLGIVVLAFLLVRALFGERIAPVLAAMVALAPFQIHYAQEVRMYALLACLLIGATWTFWQGFQTGKGYWWALFALAAAAAQYTHHLAGIYLVPLALTPLLARRWVRVRPVALSGLAALALYLPWLVRLPEQFSKVQQAYWTIPPSPARLFTTLLSYLTNLPLPGFWLPLGLSVTLTCVSLAAWQTWRAWHFGQAGARRGLWLAYLAFTPPLLLFLVSLWEPVYIERALLPSGVAFLLWLGWAIFATGMPVPARSLALVFLLAGMGAGIFLHLSYTGFPYGPYQALDQDLRQRARPGEIILHSNKLTALPAVYYDRALSQAFLADPPGSGSDTLALPTQQALDLYASPELGVAVGDAARVWFVIFERAIVEYQELGNSTHPHLAWLDTHYRLERVEPWGDIRLYVYTR